MKLSRTVAYAIQATVQLGAAGMGATVPSRKLAEEGKIPDRFLLQILRGLVAQGLLHSTRGVVGGYSLARKPEDISLLDIIEAIEGPVNFELPQGTSGSASLQRALKEVSGGVKRELAQLRLSHLMPKEKKAK